MDPKKPNHNSNPLSVDEIYEKEFDPAIKIKFRGIVWMGSDGTPIPQELLRYNGRDREIDHVWIESRVDKGDIEYWMFVSEEIDGKMAEALQTVAEEAGHKIFPCYTYDPELDADVYVMDGHFLELVWKKYVKMGKSKVKDITAAQREARKENMAKALEKRQENRAQNKSRRIHRDRPE